MPSSAICQSLSPSFVSFLVHKYPGRTVALLAVLANQSQNRYLLMVSDFELAVNFVLLCSFLKAGMCFIKNGDNLGKFSCFILDYRKCNMRALFETSPAT